MVAVVIMAFGMIALVGLMGQMRRSADVAKQRGEAVRLAQRDIEQLRAYSVLAAGSGSPAAGVRDFDTMVASTTNTNAGDLGGNATYTLQRTVVPWFDGTQPQLTIPTMRAVSVSVTWLDRANDLQTVQIHSFITRADPGLGGSLGVAPTTTALRGPAGHVPVVPLGAKDWGDKTSVFKPQPGGTVAWIFNNITGAVIGRCTVPAGTPTALLALADLSTCITTSRGLLLSGYVRFSDSAPPDSAAPTSTAIPLDMVMNVTDGAATDPNYECYDDAPFTSVGATATVVSYYCVVYPNNSVAPSWSGTLRIKDIPVNSVDSSVISPWQVCRYSGNYNGDQTISNFEHPLTYNQVTTALTSQNFLLIRASASCPAGHVADPARGIYANTETVMHQSLQSPQGVDTPAPPTPH